MSWKRLLALLHNYLGFALSLLFVLWFGSGIVLMYKGYPDWTPSEQLRQTGLLTGESLRLSPGEAIDQTGLSNPPRELRLTTLDDRPVYRLKGNGGRWHTLFADQENSYQFKRSDARRLLQKKGFKPSGKWTKLSRPDQWTLTGLDFDAHKPLYRIQTGKNGHGLVYLSSRTGEVVQYLSLTDRVWGYLGAVVHWIYPTMLRRQVALWDSVVVWSSALGTLVSLLGVIVGVVFFRWDQFGRWLRSFLPGSNTTNSKPLVPYKGWLNWHTYLGFVFGLVTCTWIFSGMLSMSPMDWHSYVPSRTASVSLAGGNPPVKSLTRSPEEAVRACNREISTRSLRLLPFRSNYYYYCLESPGTTRLVPASKAGVVMKRFEFDRILTAVRKSLSGYSITDATLKKSYDNYYYSGRPTRLGVAPPRLPYVRIKVNDPAQSWLYLDLYTGRVAKTVRYRDRWNRWLYHGLHSLDFPFLYRDHRTLWWGMMWFLLIGGLGISFTGLWLTIDWVRNKIPF